MPRPYQEASRFAFCFIEIVAQDVEDGAIADLD